MKIFLLIIILINLSVAIYLIFMVVSFHHGRRVSKSFGLNRAVAINAIRQIYTAFAIGVTVISFYIFDVTISAIVSSVFSFLVIVFSKILIDNSPYYVLNPSKKIDTLSSILAIAMFFSVFILFFSIWIVMEY